MGIISKKIYEFEGKLYKNKYVRINFNIIGMLITSKEKKHLYIFDSWKLEKVEIFKWCSGKENYLKTHIYKSDGTKTTLMFHNYIMDFTPTKKLTIDHFNRIVFDNREFNLGIKTNREQILNQNKRENCSSNCYGIYFHKQAKKFQTQIQIDEKVKHFGYFKTEKEAALKANAVYAELAIKEPSYLKHIEHNLKIIATL